MNETNYRIRFKKGNFEVEVQGDKQFVIEKFEELTKGEMVPTEDILKTRAVVSPSLVEFLKARGDPKSYTDISMVFAYWLFHKENMLSFNKHDFINCYAKTGIPKNRTFFDISLKSIILYLKKLNFLNTNGV